MSTTHIPAEMRREVTLRARHLCEYCLIHADDTYWGCQIDHIISRPYSDLVFYSCSHRLVNGALPVVEIKSE